MKTSLHYQHLEQQAKDSWENGKSWSVSSALCTLKYVQIHRDWLHMDSSSSSVEVPGKKRRGLTKGFKGSWWETLAQAQDSKISSPLKGKASWLLNYKKKVSKNRIVISVRLIITFKWHCLWIKTCSPIGLSPLYFK